MVGPIVGRKVKTFLRIEGEDILAILPPEADGGPFRINASIADKNGQLIFRIVENEWRTPTENWDVETVGQRITIRQRIGDISLVVRTDPPNRLIFERINLVHRGTRIFTDTQGGLSVHWRGRSMMRANGVEGENLDTLIDVGEDGQLAVGVAADDSVGMVYIGQASFGGGARAQSGVGRNSPCPCGGGKKYKHCHGRHT